MDGWIGLSGCGKWMDVESGKWRGSGSHTRLTFTFAKSSRSLFFGLRFTRRMYPRIY